MFRYWLKVCAFLIRSLNYFFSYMTDNLALLIILAAVTKL